MFAGEHTQQATGQKGIMNSILRYALGHFTLSPLWIDPAPVRQELFSVERLEQHAQSLAAVQPISTKPPYVPSLRARLNDNATVLFEAYHASAVELDKGRTVVPAAEWLLDNYHLVEKQIREVRNDLPPGFYRQLPKLGDGPFAGYPRVFSIAWAFVAHTDSHFDPEALRRFLIAYQQVHPLTIGELWAIAITLRFVLIENLRRLADQMTAGRKDRADADTLASQLLTWNSHQSLREADVFTRSPEHLSEPFAAQLAKRLRDHDPITTPAVGWLEQRLAKQNTSIDEVVHHAQQRQGASNLSVRNVITSMRVISEMDWAELFEAVSLVDEHLRAGSPFASMDFPTRNLYRSAIEQLARGSKQSELEIADAAINASKLATTERLDVNGGVVVTEEIDAASAERAADPGYHLIAEGRRAFEKSIGFVPPIHLRINRFNIHLGIAGYVGANLLIATGLMTLLMWTLYRASQSAGLLNPWLLAAVAVLGFLPATEVAVALVNRIITRRFGATILPALELKDGVPAEFRTIVAIPTLLTSEADLLEQIERLEIHHLSGAKGEISFALLTDGLDADQEVVEADEQLLELATKAIAELNLRYANSGSRFFLLHRRRVFNASENKWMGWERKRGKLHELNRLLRGATDTTFLPIPEDLPQLPTAVRYVITLDADTRLPRDSARRLIGKMAHPLNRPCFSKTMQRVINGHGILQPRVTPALPFDPEGSPYQRVFAGPCGMDPYAMAVSDVYQDLFGEGSYTGKGIYDLDAFEASLAGRVPDNTMLSHDLFEGVFARAGLASDIEVVEDFPSRYDVAAKRQHRWTRGDWQLLPWIINTRKGNKVPAVGRWKMADNLRRSVLAPLTLATLVASWLLPMPVALIATLAILTVIVVPILIPILFVIFPQHRDVRVSNHVDVLIADIKLAALQLLLLVALLPDQAWRMGDAIIRTLTRLCATRRHLLEWTTAAQAAGNPRLLLKGFYQQMLGSTLLGVGLAIVAVVLSPSSWPLALPFVLLWSGAPALAFWSSHPPKIKKKLAISSHEKRALRHTARRTWRFFETFVTASENMLPPDNFQDDPRPVVAHRTSPTNMGLYLLSTVAARDFGWIGLNNTIERLEATLATMDKLARFRGHFFNWYDTQDMRALEPAYVSSVDSGNLAGHLITLANACEVWMLNADSAPPPSNTRRGISDNLQLARDTIPKVPAASGERGRQLTVALNNIETQLHGELSLKALLPTLKRLADTALKEARSLVNILPSVEGDAADLLFWLEALVDVLDQHSRELLQPETVVENQKARLKAIADNARNTAMAMDFAFLLDPDRKLLSIGYSLTENRLDPSCYDLLASEARLASLFAIAKGDAETKHWFRLGRATTPIGKGSALISWSGSMFEYLMPSLVMRAPIGSLLEQTTRLVVQRQQSYAWAHGVPWGISESAYNARDMEFTYQYFNFGVPGLGFKRGLSENLVIAPYATGLATMIDPQAACMNYERLAHMGALGRYGFYEAVDFTRARLPDNKDLEIVHNFMAHHQGMTIVAIANTLYDGQMRTRFHREPMIKACDLLLQERLPRNTPIAQPLAEEVRTSAANTGDDMPAVRRFVMSSISAHPRPVTHLLSNGRYTVMVTTSGSGYSQWRDTAITRWREDATLDNWGSFIFLRDVRSNKIWSASPQPIVNDVENHWDSNSDNSEIIFGEDHAQFIYRDGTLTTKMDVLVSSEDDGEVRRVTLINSGRRIRQIELTSYAEIVLTSPATDKAHQAFAKMFVQTEYLAEYGALIATRRPRSPSEQPVWAAHFTVVEGELVADPQYESDRAKFLGRSRQIDAASAIVDRLPLSNTVGTVLDPIFSLRQRVKVHPGEVVRVAYWTLVASSRAELLDLIDKHLDRSSFDRAHTLAWTQAQVQLRHLGVTPDEAADFQRMTAPIIYSNPQFRPSSENIIRGSGLQSGLWANSISGDVPIVLLRIDNIEDIAQVRQLLRAHEYWRMKRLSVDIVILNDRASSYVQDLQIAIETLVRSSQSRLHFGAELAQTSVYTLRTDLLSTEARDLLHSVARVVLVAHRGLIAEQLARMPKSQNLPLPANLALLRRQKVMLRPPATEKAVVETISETQPEQNLAKGLEFFNGIGGFAENGTEYMTILTGDLATPAPWINVISNPNFGFQVSTEGSGYTWAENSKENQLTPWSNDPVSDPAGEAFYIRDEETFELWSATAQPIRDGGTYVARHGHGYSRFEHETNGISAELLQYVPISDPIKISRLTLRNLSGRTRQLSVTAYTELVLGTARGTTAPFIITSIDSDTGALLARNPWNTAFPSRITFADFSGQQTAWTTDRTEFLGRDGRFSSPAALAGSTPSSKAPPLSGKTGAGLDPCVALQNTITLAPGKTIELVFFLGQSGSPEAVATLINRYRTIDLDAVLKEVTDYWGTLLNSVQVKTPDRSMDIMLNGWLLYQTLACRIWARSAFYQASGAYGFRDQLQDGMALTFAQPEATRSHLLRAASRQFVEGDVQHWWLPHSGQGVRTRISDDRVWLAYGTATYVTTSGDTSILDEPVSFLQGQLLAPGEHDAFFIPTQADEPGSLFEHCARGLDQCLELTGELGLPLIGTGDWNDGMNSVGEEGKGESVWLAWLLIKTIEMFAPLAEKRSGVSDLIRAQRWRSHAASVHAALEANAWDGEWYRRATFDDGTWLGSKSSDECQIDSIAQSWAVLSGAADPVRAATAMESVSRKLIRRADGMALLFTPPFDKTMHEPGYIKGYPPGLRENGGQYSHAAMWAIFAFAKLNAGDKAADLFSLLNPINHANTPYLAGRYKVEPYVVAADVYSVAPHVGRGGWTWYTGAAGWMYRAGIDGILGIRREGKFLVIDPCIPVIWPGFEATVNVASTQYVITVTRTIEKPPSQRCRGISYAELDNVAITPVEGHVRVPLNGGKHQLLISI